LDIETTQQIEKNIKILKQVKIKLCHLPAYVSLASFFFDREEMMEQGVLFGDIPNQDPNVKGIGDRLFLKFGKKNPHKVSFYQYNNLIKTVDLSDRVAKRLLVVEAVEMGAIKSRLAAALKISRQSIHNYTETKKHFGLEGLVHNYSAGINTSRRQQRQDHVSRRGTGNKARQLEQMRKEQKQQLPEQTQLVFGEKIAQIAPEDHPFADAHDWKQTRYAGAFVYLITLITQNRWLSLVMEYFGSKYKIFMVFALMVAHNIRSIEQLKNLNSREGGIAMGISRLPTRLKTRHWLHEACRMKISKQLLTRFFRSQLQSGIVGIWLWFTDGHHLPYTGKRKLHAGYNTQRRMPEPARTNLVTSDNSGRIVDFEIQEGQGDLRGYIVHIAQKWREDVTDTPVTEHVNENETRF
jgi:hypothetical protein